MNKSLLSKIGIGTAIAVTVAAAAVVFVWHEVTEALAQVDWDNLNL